MQLAAINVFPVKSLAGVTLSSSLAQGCGLAGDRRWMVVDPDGTFLTQRDVPRMARVRATPRAAGLRLSVAEIGGIDVEIPAADAPRLDVTVWRDQVAAWAAAPEANAWIGLALGRPARLVHLSDPAARPISSSHGRPGEHVSFADGFPVLLTSLASLADLNARLRNPVPMDRFRGNLVVEGAPPWAEDAWRMIRIGGAAFRVAKPCARCIMTTIDQATGERPDRTEPLRALAGFRNDEDGLMFGQNLVPVALGPVAVGDAVEVLEFGVANVRHAHG